MVGDSTKKLVIEIAIQIPAFLEARMPQSVRELAFHLELLAQLFTGSYGFAHAARGIRLELEAIYRIFLEA